MSSRGSWLSQQAEKRPEHPALIASRETASYAALASEVQDLAAVLRGADVHPGDRVAVFGVGPIGMFAVQWAKIVGAGEVFAVDIFSEKLKVAEELGADVTINGRQVEPVDVIRSRTGGRGVERCIEFAGHPATQEQSILAASKRGSVVWGGISHAGLELSEAAVDSVLRNELIIAGSWNSSFSPLRSDWDTSLRLMRLGRLTPENVVTHRLPLDRVRDAFTMMASRAEYFGKVMFYPEM